ncbi:MAG: NAD-dependent epimerase/dehydratase family protein [Verrucomicrobia bacterium]|nr:NAD-dependent epimerase/dehydratase family protein [Verrucomicrobiota bacterium]
MNFRRDESIMLAALTRRFFEQRESGGDLEVWGDGTALREYTYSRDMARACLWCLDHFDGEGILNIGSTEENSVATIASLVAESLGLDPDRIRFDRTKPGGIHRRPTDNSTFVALSGFQYTPFREALQGTARWFEDHVSIPGAVRL